MSITAPDPDDLCSVASSCGSFDDSDYDSWDAASNFDPDDLGWQYQGALATSHAVATPTEIESSAWHPLSAADQFRVLKIEEPKHASDPISVSLEVWTLDGPGKYFALSYTWGGEEYTHDVRCGPYVVPITANLHAALVVIRDLFYSTECSISKVQALNCDHDVVVEKKAGRPLYPFIWADAICINQSDLVERARQVMIMNRIFSKARHLFIWLGSAYESTILEGSEEGETCSEIIARVFDAPWFQRRWVIQEANLNIGKRSIISNGRLLDICQSELSTEGASDSAQWSRSPLVDCRKMPLLRILQQYEDSICHDPHDIVYSLLSVSSDAGCIIPNYTKCVEDAFIEVARYCVRSRQVLQLLVCVAGRPLVISSSNPRESKKDFQDIISWIPDWRLPWGDEYSLLALPWTMHEKLLASLPSLDADESLESTQSLQFFPTLVLRGWILSECDSYKHPRLRVLDNNSEKRRIIEDLRCLNDDYSSFEESRDQNADVEHELSGSSDTCWDGGRSWYRVRERLSDQEEGEMGSTRKFARVSIRLKIMKRFLDRMQMSFESSRQTSGASFRWRDSSGTETSEELHIWFENEYCLLERYMDLERLARSLEKEMPTEDHCPSCFMRVGWEIEKLSRNNTSMDLAADFALLCLPKTEVTLLVVPAERPVDHDDPHSQTSFYRLVTCFLREAFEFDGKRGDFVKCDRTEFNESPKYRTRNRGYSGKAFPESQMIKIV